MASRSAEPAVQTLHSDETRLPWSGAAVRFVAEGLSGAAGFEGERQGAGVSSERMNTDKKEGNSHGICDTGFGGGDLVFCGLRLGHEPGFPLIE